MRLSPVRPLRDCESPRRVWCWRRTRDRPRLAQDRQIRGASLFANGNSFLLQVAWAIKWLKRGRAPRPSKSSTFSNQGAIARSPC